MTSTVRRSSRALAPLLAVLAVGAAAAPADAAFPGASGRIAYTSDVEYGATFVESAAVRGGQRTRLTDAGTDFAPAWSPDGSRLAYTTYDGAIMVMNADGSAKRQVATGVEAAADPSWAPDGKRLVFVGGRDAAPGMTPDIYTVSADGTGLRRLTNGPLEDAAPAWSPDGSTIVWSMTRTDGRRAGLWRMAADGGGRRQLTTGADVAPDWAPDGRSIVFARERGDGEVWTMGATGTRARRVGSVNGTDPAFSPDGRRIVFVRGGQVWTTGSDGTGAARVTTDSARHAAPAWQPRLAPAPAG